MASILTEEVYLKPPFATLEQLATEIELWDATTAGQLAFCPRKSEYATCYALRKSGEQLQLKTGSAIHASLALFYTGGSEEECMAELAAVFGKDHSFRLPTGHRYQHLHLGHLETIFRNYMDYARKRDTFKPLLIHREQIKLDQVLGGIWKVTEKGFVVLGESKFIMRFKLTLPTGEEIDFDYAGRPDLPIQMGGAVYIMDHKTSSAYLSDYWADKHRFSNQLRGYAAMLEAITDLSIAGGLINGIFVGEKASSTEFKGNKFARFGPFLYQPAHLTEALLNQYYWKRQLYRHWEDKYFPQAGNQACCGCDFTELCNAAPATRVAAMSAFSRSEQSVMETFLKL
ncbi:MAG: hypothetical protein A2Y38_16630 [Spirochaetes bacterium GWB1_59_5]|nr:MAG: hypothetical protein A2Y38_16630 [Spirochaetes bacterium GWB1_59_5]